MKKKKTSFTLDQINLALLKAGIGPKIIAQAMHALNLARGLGIVEKESNMKTFAQIIHEASPGSEEDFTKRFPKVAAHFKDVKDGKELAKLRKAAIKKVDADEDGWKDGPIAFFVKKWKAEFAKNTMTKRSAADARSDMILRTKDSSGRAKARKF